MNEAETRAEHIAPALKAAGWGVVDGSKGPARGDRQAPVLNHLGDGRVVQKRRKCVRLVGDN